MPSKSSPGRSCKSSQSKALPKQLLVERRRVARWALVASMVACLGWLVYLSLARVSARAPRLQTLAVRVERWLPHDGRSFTQGLLLHDGKLYESSGLHGQSRLRELDAETGALLREVRLPDELFAEGLARVGDQLVQLTWKNQVAWLWDRRTLRKTGELRYQGEGWGLCYDGRSLVMSDGSSRLSFRHPSTFWLQRTLQVRQSGQPLSMLNELECVAGDVYANIWQTHRIVRIDARSGEVTASVEVGEMLSAEERRHADVLNGIAWDARRRHFWITGKLWPKLFAVRFVPLQERL